MKATDFDLLFLAGRTFEGAVKDALRHRYGVVATGSIAGEGQRGPKLEDAANGITLADLQLYRGVRRGWVEVKSKSKANPWRQWNRLEHGIDTKKYNDYLRLQDETQQTVYLIICEVESGDVLMQSLSTLHSTGRPREGGGMTNWDRSAFITVGQLEIPNDDLRKIAIVIDWRIFECFVTQPMLIEVCP